MKPVEERIAETLNVEFEVEDVSSEETVYEPEIVSEEYHLAPIEKSERDEEIQDDYELARARLREVANVAAQAMQNALMGADHPRMFEAAATLMKQVTEASRELMETHKAKKELEAGQTDSPKTINNSLFIGSTKELLELVKKAGDDNIHET